MMLNEKLNVFGWVGCGLCINGSITIVLHAPPERPLSSVLEVWEMAMQPGGILTWVVDGDSRHTPLQQGGC